MQLFICESSSEKSRNMVFPCAVIGEGNAAAMCLQHLLDMDWPVQVVFTSTKRVTQLCQQASIRTYRRNASITESMISMPGIDYLFSINNPRILDNEVLSIPRKGCINFHDSPLPAYAGVNATSWAIIHGETDHGISWHVMEPGIDTGAILQSRLVKIDSHESVLSLNLKCLEACVEAFKELTSDISKNTLNPKPQDDSRRSYFGLYDVLPNMGVLNFDTGASEVFNLARAVHFGNHDNQVGSAVICTPSGNFLLVAKAELTQAYNDAKKNKYSPGTIIDKMDNTLVVARSTDNLLLNVCELDGTKVAPEKHRFYHLTCGAKLQSLHDIDTVVAKQIRKKETFWRQKLKSYEPTMLTIQKLTWKPHGFSVSAHSRKEEIIQLPQMVMERADISVEDYAMALFIAFLGRICCETEVHIGMLGRKDNIPDQIKSLYSDVYPGIFKLQYSQTIDQNVEQCKKMMASYREGKTFPKDLFYRYTDLRDLKKSPLHNLVLGFEDEDSAQQVRHDTFLSEASMIIILSRSEMKLFFDDRAETPFGQIVEVMRRFPTFMQSVHGQDGVVPLLDIALLSASESKQLYQQPTECTGEEKEDIMDKFLSLCKIRPNHPALISTDTRLTYEQLEQEIKMLCNKIANVLPQDYKVTRKCLGLHLPNSLAYVAGVMTSTLMKCPFLPLPIDLPLERLKCMLQDSRCSVMMVLTDTLEDKVKWNSLPPSTVLTEVQTVFGDLAVLALQQGADKQDNDEFLTDHEDISEQTQVQLSETCCYVIYTSGSTGKPKGLQCRRSGVLNLTNAQIKCWDLGPTDVIAQFASISFDASISEIFTAFLSGATLAVLKDTQRLGKELMDTINNLKVTVATFPPALLNIYGPNDFPTLTKVVTAGEACTVSIANKWAANPCTRFFNAYGPAENTVCATIFEFFLKDVSDYALQDLPIGKAIPGVVVYLFDEFMKPVPPSVVGEIYIGGKSLCDGYIGHAMSRNKERFLQNPIAKGELLYRTGDHGVSTSDGTLTYIGRLDNQVKLRGQMVNLNEVEKLILQHPKVEMAIAVKHQSNRSAGPCIAAFLAPMSVSASELREYLSMMLPKHAVPTVIIPMNKDKFPMNLNGKVDRKRLEEDDSIHDQNIGCDSGYLQGTQLAMAKLWCEILKLDQSYAFGMNNQSSFTGMGGNSLHRVLLQRAIEKEFQVQLSFMDVITASTISEFDEIVRKTRTDRWDALPDQTNKVSSKSLRENILVDSILNFTELPKAILLSGATGFLGAFLLKECLDQTDAVVYCMVRDSTVKGAYEKLETNMRNYDLWRPGFESRVLLVLSDLSKPKLGMTSDVYTYLSKHIDTVFMNAAKMNFNTDYNDHRLVNVDSTRELIKFTLTGKSKFLFYTSSLSVFLFPCLEKSNNQQGQRIVTFSESDIIEDPIDICGGYGQSKWVSDKLVLQALEKVPGGAVFRPARVSGDSYTGVGSTSDLFASIMLGMKKMGVAPDMDFPFDLTPVNYCARAMVEIMIQMYQNPAPEMPKVYHFFNKSTIPFRDLFDGMDVKKIPLDEFRLELARTDPENELLPFTQFFFSDFWDKAHHWPTFNTDNTDRYTSEDTRQLMPSSKSLLKTYKKFFSLFQSNKISNNRKRDVEHT